MSAGVVAPDEVRQKLINSENSGYNGIDEEFEEAELRSAELTEAGRVRRFDAPKITCCQIRFQVELIYFA